MSEETKNASWSAPIGVLMSISCSAVFGFFLIVCLLFSVQNFDKTINSEFSQPVLQIMLDCFGETGATVLFTLIIVCVWHCGLFSMTSNSRMMFSFSRDGALPKFFRSVDKRWRSPVRTVWLAATLSFLLAVPSLGSAVAFTAATSIATIGLYISYALPILIGVLNPKGFIHGPFNLRWFSKINAIIACAYVMFITIIFCLPQENPVNSQSLNYTPVCVGIVGAWCIISWFPWARKWFKGPIRQIELSMAGVNVDDPGEVEKAERENRIPSLTATGQPETGQKSLLAEMKTEYNK